MNTLSDFGKLSYNFIQKGPNIYDTIYFLSLHQQKFDTLGDMTEYEASNWWFKLGIYYGTAVQQTFYTPSEFDDSDSNGDEYTGLQDD